MADVNLTNGTITDGNGSRHFSVGSPSRANDGDDLTSTDVPAYAGGGGTAYLKSDLGSDFSIGTAIVKGHVDFAQPSWTIEHSADAAAWTAATAVNSWVGNPSFTETLTLNTPHTARYWRIKHAVTSVAFHPPIKVYTWQLNGAAPAGTVTADFSGTPLSGIAPLAVQFTDTSSGTPTSWSWNFGDGSAAGTAQNPEHEYTSPGIYTVSLTVDGTSVETKAGYVTVNSSGVVLGDDFLEIPAGDIMSWRISRSGGAAGLGEGYTGAATIILKNRANRYNPENESSDIIDLLRDGTRIWLGVNADGTITPDASKTVHGQFAGRITEITVIPSKGTDNPATVEFVCEDPLSWIDRTPVTISASQHRSQLSLRTEILSAAGETVYDLDDENATMPLSYADGNAGNILDELNKANASRHFARPADDPDTWYHYVSVQRMAGLGGVAAGTVNAGTQHVTDTSGWRTSADTIVNQQRVTIEPYYFRSAQVPVWEYEDVPFPANRRPEIWVDFDDYVALPSLDLNYTGGTVTAALTDFGTSAKITLTDPGTATVTQLRVLGALARRGPAQSVIVDDEDSQDPPRGIRAGSEISGDFVGPMADATGVAEHIVWRYADPKYRPDLTIVNWLPTQFVLDLYDTLAVTSTHIGVAARIFEIVGLTHEGHRAADSGVVHHVTTYQLMESRIQTATDWFVLNTSTCNSTHILGY